MKKKLLSVVTTLAMALSAMPMMSMTAGATVSYTYCRGDGSEDTAYDVKPLSSGDSTWSDGWYVVDKDVTITSEINNDTDSDTINIILMDGCTLTCSDDITMSGSSVSLNIYGQSAGTGKLVVNKTFTNDGGYVTINGGKIDIQGVDSYYSIYNNCATFKINNGIVNASGAIVNYGSDFTINGGYFLASNEDGDAFYNDMGSLDFSGGTATFSSEDSYAYNGCDDTVYFKDTNAIVRYGDEYFEELYELTSKSFCLSDEINQKKLSFRYHDNNDCITFSSPESFTLEADYKSWNGTLYYSTDKSNWNEWDASSIDANLCTTGEHVIYLYGDVDNTNISDCSSFTLDGSDISCTGNIETLRGATGNKPSPVQMDANCYDAMFSDCTSLISAPALPATELSNNCYDTMFSNCTSLTEAPALPATELYAACYANMFSGCTSLIKAPALNATKLDAGNCYYKMFKDCKRLYITKSDKDNATWTIPASSVSSTVEDMTLNCYTESAKIELPTSGVNYYKVVGVYDITNASKEADKATNNGYISVAASAPEGTKVSVTVTPSTSYKLTKLTYTPTYGNEVDITSAKEFTMPGKKVTIKATFAVDITPSFTTTSDSGYFADAKTSSTKNGIIAFTSIFDNLATDYADYIFGEDDKFGLAMFTTSNSIGDLDKASLTLDVSKTTFDDLESAEGYFYSFVKNIPVTGFDTTVYAIPFAIIGGTTTWGTMVNATVNADHWLGDEATYSPIK